jgi:triacylglycerol esterase/lipase EstA (alpha/beta hydrolase family)
MKAAASKLNTLVERIIREEPDPTINFLGHSMGGMVIAYWISQQDSDFLEKHVGSVVTLDSPLFDGHPLADLVDRIKSCKAWADIKKGSDVLKSINEYSKTTERVPFYHINSSAIGDLLPGGVELAGSCENLKTSLISQTFSHLNHSCLWSKESTYDLLARVIFSPHRLSPVDD